MRKPRDVAARVALAHLTLMVAVVAAFVVHSIVNVRASDVINHQVDEVMDNAVPSVEYLADARAQLRGMETAVQRAVRSANAASAAPAENVLASKHQAMDAAMSAYMEMPAFPVEPELQREIADARAHLDDSMNDTLVALAAGDMAKARADLGEAERASDRLDETLKRSVVFNAAQAARIGRSMSAERQNLDQRILLVDAAIVALAVGATVFAALTWRRSIAAVEARASELDMFAGRVAHDVLSPLMAVGMGLSLSRVRLAGDPGATAMLERSQRALDRVRDLVGGLLEFARAGAAPEVGQPVAARDTIRAVLETLQEEAAGAGVEVRFEPGPELQVACAPGCLVSLVQNLVRNAIRYIDGAPLRLVTVRVHDARPFVRVEVEDTGPGIPEPICRRLFEPFVRGTDAVPGIGLGLATAKRLAEGHGGRIGCRSAVGAGSLFWFELPAARPRSEDRSARLGHPSASATAT